MRKLIKSLDNMSQEQVNIMMTVISGLILVALMVWLGDINGALDVWWHQQYELPMSNLD